jgi:rhamnogalacturonyl hydrolase YesR
MALVEVLDYMPKTHPKRAELINILSRFAAAIEKTQDVVSGAWYQIPNKPTEKGNYLEASGTSMHVFTLAKSVRLGYLDKKYLKVAEKGYEGILKNFIEIDSKNMVHLTKTCSGAGLGGVPYRSGTFDYYINEPLRTDDLKGIGAFIQADLEMNLVK